MVRILCGILIIGWSWALLMINSRACNLEGGLAGLEGAWRVLGDFKMSDINLFISGDYMGYS